MFICCVFVKSVDVLCVTFLTVLAFLRRSLRSSAGVFFSVSNDRALLHVFLVLSDAVFALHVYLKRNVSVCMFCFTRKSVS